MSDKSPKIICYTAIFGSIRDHLHPPELMDPQVTYIAFVDPEIEKQGVKNGWYLHPPMWQYPNKRRQARRHKCLPHILFPAVDYTLWVDGCLTPRQSIAQLIEQALAQHDLATFKHTDRNCIYQEAEACIRLKKDDPALIRAQMNRYREDNYPHHNGLAETTAVLRRHTRPIAEFNRRWWNEIEAGSQRDQLSMDYVAWQLGLKYAHLAGTRTSSPLFRWRDHR